MVETRRDSRRVRAAQVFARQRDEAAGAPCWWCRQPIDYSLPFDDPAAYQPDHLLSWADHPEARADPGNLYPSHQLCNKNRGNGSAQPGLNVTSRNW